jgi:hypothetical protein
LDLVALEVLLNPQTCKMEILEEAAGQHHLVHLLHREELVALVDQPQQEGVVLRFCRQMQGVQPMQLEGRELMERHRQQHLVPIWEAWEAAAEEESRTPILQRAAEVEVDLLSQTLLVALLAPLALLEVLATQTHWHQLDFA